MTGLRMREAAAVGDLLDGFETQLGALALAPLSQRSQRIRDIRKKVNQILNKNPNQAQMNELTVMELRMYNQLNKEEMAVYFADAKAVDTRSAYKEGKLTRLDIALNLLETCAKDPASYLSTTKRLLTDLNSIALTDADQRKRFTECRVKINKNLRTTAEREFLFPARKIVPMKIIDPAFLTTPEHVVIALRVIYDSRKPSYYLKELRSIHEKWSGRVAPKKEREKYQYYMKQIEGMLSKTEMEHVTGKAREQESDIFSRSSQQIRPTLLEGRMTLYPSAIRDLGTVEPHRDTLKWLTDTGARQFAEALRNGTWGGVVNDQSKNKSAATTMQELFKDAKPGDATLGGLFGTADPKQQKEILDALKKGDVLQAYNLARQYRLADSPMAQCIFDNVAAALRKVTVLIPVAAFMHDAEWTVFRRSRISISVNAFVDLLLAGQFTPELKQKEDGQLFLSLLRKDEPATRMTFGAGTQFDISPRKIPREGESVFIGARIEAVPGGGSKYLDTSQGVFTIGYKDESGKTTIRSGKTPLYYAGATSVDTEGRVVQTGAIGFGVGKDINGKPSVIMLSGRYVLRDSEEKPSLHRMKNALRWNIGIGKKTQLEMQLNMGAFGKQAIISPAWTVGAGAKVIRQFEKWVLEAGGEIELGEYQHNEALQREYGNLFTLFTSGIKVRW